jgi:hypothetical protein
MGNLETVEALYEAFGRGMFPQRCHVEYVSEQPGQIQDAISRLPHRPSLVVRSGLQSVRTVVPHRQVQFVAVEVHVPAVSGVEIASSIQMFGHQRRILISRGRTALGSRPPTANATRRDPT